MSPPLPSSSGSSSCYFSSFALLSASSVSLCLCVSTLPHAPKASSRRHHNAVHRLRLASFAQPTCAASQPSQHSPQQPGSSGRAKPLAASSATAASASTSTTSPWTRTPAPSELTKPPPLTAPEDGGGGGGGIQGGGSNGGRRGQLPKHRVGEGDSHRRRRRHRQGSMSELFYRITSRLLAGSGAAVVLLGALRAWYTMAELIFTGKWFNTQSVISLDVLYVRARFCKTVLLALDFLVASDVVETLTSPLHQIRSRDIVALVALIALRAMLTYLLDLEVKHIQYHIIKANKKMKIFDNGAGQIGLDAEQLMH
eukprot:jgi/Chlat1/9150/Chrsp97S08442